MCHSPRQTRPMPAAPLTADEEAREEARKERQRIYNRTYYRRRVAGEIPGRDPDEDRQAYNARMAAYMVGWRARQK